MAMGSGAEDPGWRGSLGGLWWVLAGQITRQQKRDIAAGIHGLTTLRRLFASFVAVLVMVGGAVVIMLVAGSLKQGPLAGVYVAVGVILFGTFSLLAPRLIEKPLDCSEDRRLAVSYRIRFFLRVAFANAAALVGFVGFIESANGWVYALGAGFAAVGYCRLVPTAANLAKDQRALAGASCPDR